MDYLSVNFVTATVNNPKLLSMAFQDTFLSTRSLVVAAVVAMMNNSAINVSCAK